MSKVWEFAVTPKQAVMMGACLVFSGLFLSGAGFFTGLLLAPRRNEIQARLATARRTVSPPRENKPAKAVTSTPAEAPAPATPPVNSSAQIETGLEPAVLAPSASGPPASVPAVMSALVPAPVAPGAPAPAPGLPQATAAKPKPAPLPIQMTVRVGSFSIDENARNFVERLKHFGYPAVDLPNTDARGHQWHVVQVGPYAAYDEASRTALELSSKYRLEPLIIPLTAF